MYQFVDAHNLPLSPEQLQGRTVDISEGGFQLEGPPPAFCDPQHLLQHNVHMFVALKTESTDIECVCAIRTVKPMGSTCDYGLQIAQISDEARKRMREMYSRASMTQISRRKTFL